MQKYVAVTFPGSNRTYTYHHDIPGLKPGDEVIVETDRGESRVTVSHVAAKPSFKTKAIKGRVPDDREKA